MPGFGHAESGAQPPLLDRIGGWLEAAVPAVAASRRGQPQRRGLKRGRGQSAAQGLTRSTPVPSKSFVLRVASVAPRRRRDCRYLRVGYADGSAGLLAVGDDQAVDLRGHGVKRCDPLLEVLLEQAADRLGEIRPRRVPPGRRVTPYHNSAAVMAVVPTSLASSSSSQASTPGSGSERVSSETTLVSSRINGQSPLLGPPRHGREAQAGPGPRTARGSGCRGRRRPTAGPGRRGGWPGPRTPWSGRAVPPGRGGGLWSPRPVRESSATPPRAPFVSCMHCYQC